MEKLDDDKFVESLKSSFKAENLEYPEGLQKFKIDNEFRERILDKVTDNEEAEVNYWHGTNDPRGW